MDFFDFIIILGVGFALGKLHAYLTFGKIIQQIADDAGVDLEREIAKLEESEKTKVVPVYQLHVENINDILYLYDTDSDDFLCQGSSMGELALACKQYNNIILAAVKYQEQIFMFVNGTSKEYTE